MTAEPRCIHCGNVGTDAEPIGQIDGGTYEHVGFTDALDNDGPYYECPPMPRGWAACATCSEAMPVHALVGLDGYAGTFYCREDVNPDRLAYGGWYVKVTCTCEACVDAAWRGMTGTGKAARAGGRARGRKAAEPKDKAPTVVDRVRDALTEGEALTSAALAEALGVTDRSVRSALAVLKAEATRDGRSVTWRLP